MTKLLSNNLSKDKIGRLLAAMGTLSGEDQQQVAATEYNWREPHYFNKEQVERLFDFASKLAMGLTERLTAVCKNRCEINVASVVQLCADDFLAQIRQDSVNGYCLAFSMNKEPAVGVVNLPRETAITWIDRLLGKSESSDRSLSETEESLLSDFVVAVIGAFSKACGNVDCRPDGSMAKGKWPVAFQKDDELCRITLTFGQVDSAPLQSQVKTGSPQADSKGGSKIEIIMPCRKLEAMVVGKQASVGPSADEVSKLIFGYLERIPVCVKVILGHSTTSLGQILDLEPEDVIILNKRIDEPAELMIEDRVILHGWMAKSEGQYAVVVSESASNEGSKHSSASG